MDKKRTPAPSALGDGSAPRPGGRARQRAELHQRLYRAALTLFGTRGLQATTVREIAAAADVGRQTFSNHFAAKEGVLVQFYAEQCARVEDTLRTVRGGAQSVPQALATLMGRLCEEPRHPLLTRTFLQAILSNDRVSSMALPHLTLRQHLYEEILHIGQQRGEIRQDRSAADLARALLEFAFGTALFWSCRSDVPLPLLLEANLRVLDAPPDPKEARHEDRTGPGARHSPDTTRSPIKQHGPATQRTDSHELGRRERRRLEIRDRLFRSATELISARGLQQTTVQDITEAADVGKGTFFNYFPTKEHILAMFYERQLELVQRALHTAREAREPLLKTLNDLVTLTSQPAAGSAALVRGFLVAIVSSDAVRALVLPPLVQSREAFEELYAIGQHRGEIRRDIPAYELARLGRDSAFGTSLFWSLRPVLPLSDLLAENRSLIWSSAPYRGKPTWRGGERSVRRKRIENGATKKRSV